MLSIRDVPSAFAAVHEKWPDLRARDLDHAKDAAAEELRRRSERCSVEADMFRRDREIAGRYEPYRRGECDFDEDRLTRLAEAGDSAAKERLSVFQHPNWIFRSHLNALAIEQSPKFGPERPDGGIVWLGETPTDGVDTADDLIQMAIDDAVAAYRASRGDGEIMAAVLQRMSPDERRQFETWTGEAAGDDMQTQLTHV